MEKDEYGFGFRFERALGERIVRYCKKETVSLNDLVECAVCFAGHLHDKRKIIFDRASGFSERLESADKLSTVLIVKADIREIVLNFAVVYRKSMAEIIRVALEVFLDFQDTGKRRAGEIRHYYNKPQMCIQCSVISLYPIFPPQKPPITEELGFL